MTLIIGCNTEHYGIIAGDTQLTTKGLERENKVRRSVELKVSQCATDLMFGILGEWGWFSADDEGNANYINDYDLLQKGIANREVTDKLGYLNKFLIGREKIEASAIYIKRNEGAFELDSVSNNDEGEDLKTITTDDYKLVFNEPFFSLDNSYVTKKISHFIKAHELDSSLTDNLFLINNIILEIISEGKSFSIFNNNETYLDINNTVGGYITIQIMTKNGIHYFNYLASPYNNDYNCLIDKTTNPFSNYLDYNKIIRYVDNLGMIIKNINNQFIEEDVIVSLKELVFRQVLHIDSLNIIDKADLNKLIAHINKNYDIKIPLIEIKPIVNVVGTTDISLENLIFDEDEVNYVSVEFLLRFL